MKDRSNYISLAVLPFDNLTGDAEKDYFSRGFVEDIITYLSRFPSLQIISSHTSLSEKIKADWESAKKFDIQYFLMGKLRQMGDKIRINTQLFDPNNQTVLWAEKYDAPMQSIFDIQDSIVEKVVSSLSVQIDTRRLAEARKKEFTNLESYDSWLRGYEYLRRGTIKDDEKARNIFNHALKIDPFYGRAYAGLSLSYFNEWTCQFWDRWEENINAAHKFALKATSYNANDHVAQMILGRILVYRRDFDLALKHINTALELNPNDADNLVQIASCKALLGHSDEAVVLFNKAIKLNPMHFNWYNIYGVMIYFAAEDYDNLIKLAEEIPATLSVDLPAYLAIAYSYKSNNERAAYYLNLYIKNFIAKITFGREPQHGEAFDWVIAVNPYKKQTDIQRFVEGLELAGLKGNESGESFFIKDPKDQFNFLENTFKKKTTLWELTFNNLSVQLPEVKGFIDISKLLANPNKEIHCSELMGNITSLSNGIEAIDEKAKRKYKIKIDDLQTELQKAEEMNDLGRVELLSNELNEIIDNLKRATGLGGRKRKLADPGDRARAAVTLRVKSAIQKIESVHPSLAKHLQNNIKTGSFCTYLPDTGIEWHL